MKSIKEQLSEYVNDTWDHREEFIQQLDSMQQGESIHMEGAELDLALIHTGPDIPVVIDDNYTGFSRKYLINVNQIPLIVSYEFDSWGESTVEINTAKEIREGIWTADNSEIRFPLLV